MSIHQESAGVGSIEDGKIRHRPWVALFRRRGLWAVALTVSLPLAAFRLQEWVFARMLAVGLGALSWVPLPTPPASVEPPAGAELPPLPTGDSSDPSLASASGKRSNVRRPVAASKSVRVSAATVEQWIRSRAVPRGRSVAPTPSLPAGVEILGAGAFGVGLGDRDRLSWLEGRNVTSPAEVIETVLGAVGRRASALTAVFLRSTPAGVVSTTLTVELPDFNKLLAEEQGAAP